MKLAIYRWNSPRKRRVCYNGFVLAAMAAIFVVGCGQKEPSSEKNPASTEGKQEIPMTIKLTSPAFNANVPIPKKHTADGANVSPPLTWEELPPGTQQLALIVDDPDAPREEPWVHWVIYEMPSGLTRLPEDVPKDDSVGDPLEAVQGVNDFGETGYGGPAPPKGHGVHHYHFKLYALDQELDLKPGLSKSQLLEAIKDHILAQGELVGPYER